MPDEPANGDLGIVAFPVIPLCYSIHPVGCDCCDDITLHVAFSPAPGKALDIQIEAKDIPALCERLMAATEAKDALRISETAVHTMRAEWHMLGDLAEPKDRATTDGSAQFRRADLTA